MKKYKVTLTDEERQRPAWTDGRRQRRRTGTCSAACRSLALSPVAWCSYHRVFTALRSTLGPRACRGATAASQIELHARIRFGHLTYPDTKEKAIAETVALVWK